MTQYFFRVLDEIETQAFAKDVDDYFLACGKGAQNMQANRATADFIRRWTRSNLDCAVTGEPSFAHADAASSLRADLQIAELGDHLHATFVDYTSVHPYAPTHCRNVIGDCSRHANRRNTRNTMGPWSWRSVVPFVIDALGVIGPAAQSFLW